MKLVIAGGRDIVAYKLLREALLHFGLGKHLEEIVHGGCRGIDSCAGLLAKENNIPCKVFEADWNKHGKSAGPKRNRQMAQYGDALLLVWDGQSKGSGNMREEMLKLIKPVYEIVIRKANTPC